jgi:thiol:disulfide interchange protein
VPRSPEPGSAWMVLIGYTIAFAALATVAWLLWV